MIPTADVIKTLIESPKKLYDQADAMQADKEYLTSLKTRAGVIEATVEADVLADSKKEDWKEALSNQTKRDREKTHRLAENVEYLDLSTQINDKEREALMKRLFYDLTEREWKSAVALANFHKQ